MTVPGVASAQSIKAMEVVGGAGLSLQRGLKSPPGPGLKPKLQAEACSTTAVRLFSNTITVGLLTSTAKLAGAAKTIVLARFFGASDQLDAFLIAFLLPSFIADLTGGSITGTLVPQLVQTRDTEGAGAARKLAGAAFAWALAMMVIFAGGLAIANRWLLRLTAGNFPEEKLHLTTMLFLGLLCWLPMSGCIAMWRAVLNAHGRFALPAIAPIASPLICIGFMFALTNRWGVGVLCIGTVAGIALECLALAVSVSRLGYPILPDWHGWRNPALAGIGKQYLPLLMGSGLASACMLIDQSFAARLGSGQVSAFVYGTRLTSVFSQVIAMSIGVTILPVLSHWAAERDWPRLRETVLRCGAACTLVALLAVALLILNSETLIRVVFERGAFHREASQLVANVQRFSLLQIPFGLLLAIAARLTSAIRANALLAQLGIIALLINFVLDFVLSRYMGLPGIALATVFVQIVSLAFLVLMLYRREPNLFRGKRV